VPREAAPRPDFDCMASAELPYGPVLRPLQRLVDSTHLLVNPPHARFAVNMRSRPVVTATAVKCICILARDGRISSPEMPALKRASARGVTKDR
jgi:hypothetical protein